MDAKVRIKHRIRLVIHGIQKKRHPFLVSGKMVGCLEHETPFSLPQ